MRPKECGPYQFPASIFLKLAQIAYNKIFWEEIPEIENVGDQVARFGLPFFFLPSWGAIGCFCDNKAVKISGLPFILKAHRLSHY